MRKKQDPQDQTHASDSHPIRASDSHPIRIKRTIRASDSAIESDAYMAFIARLRDAIGDEPVASFARRCDLPEATLRSYTNGNKPVYDKLSRIADAAGVTVDWLATGRGVKRRADLTRESETAVESMRYALPHGPRWAQIIALVEGFESEPERSALLDEFFARAQSAAELAELRQAVRALQTAVKKSA